MREDEFYGGIGECKILLSKIKKFLQDIHPAETFMVSEVRSAEGFLGYVESHGKNFLEVKE